jgi:hypothetical protein
MYMGILHVLGAHTILHISRIKVNVINRNVNEQNSRCVGVIRVTKIIKCQLTVAVSSQLTDINRI